MLFVVYSLYFFMKENGRYLGIFDVHGQIRVERGKTREEVLEKLGEAIERAKSSYPEFDWDNQVEVLEIRASRNGHKKTP